ncbi:uncharacterized protein LOC131946165 [Physella acuta]|uniref:uncharacterized protein LOC131946165 n=1 Tax=Physella acuta TaxID=109671 RepID=UPI0027DC1C22|nr:uncharacterized protein LOC131946165 [Physella acuta]
MVSQETGRTTDLINGSTGVLTCDTVSGTASWYLGDVLLSATTPSIHIKKAGVYKCQALSNTVSLHSDNSSALTITAVEGNTYSKKQTLKIEPEGTTIYPGRNVVLTCSDAPMGFAGKTTFLVDSKPVAESTKSMTTQISMNSTYSGKKISCRLEPFEQITFIDSDDMGTLPTEDANIKVTSVKAIVTDANDEELKTDTTYNIGAVGPTITCQTTPAPESLDPVMPIIYEFLEVFSSKVKQNGTSKTYKVPTTEASSSVYECSAAYKEYTAVKSALTIQVTVNPSYLTAPVLIKASLPAISIGSTLILSCGGSVDNTLTYTWFFNNKFIDGQADWKIQLYNFTVADIGEYKCQASKNRYTTANSSFHAIMKPTVTRVTPGIIYRAGCDYELKCNTGSSLTDGWSYSWTKDDAVTLIETDTYTITKAAAVTNDGKYTCTSTYNGAFSHSDPFIIAITAGASALHCCFLMVMVASLLSIF